MPLKVSDRATEWREIDRWDDGVGWLAHPDEGMQRASHAFAVDEDVWLIDPVDVEGLDELLGEFGTVAGVVLLLDRHERDADTIAARHDVSIHIPHWMDGVPSDLDAPVERVRTELADTGYGIHKLIDNRLWQEATLYGEDSGLLIVPEALGTAAFFRTGTDRVGVHPALRLFPPKRLRRFTPRRLAVGHGTGIDVDPADAIDEAIAHSRTGAPRLYGSILRDRLFG